MTKNRFYKLSQEFGTYALREVKYRSLIPSTNKVTDQTGILYGIGQGANEECVIIASGGHTHAIHHSKVDFPK